MAAPSEVTTKAINGRYRTNKDLSDSTDEMLKLQGVSWLTRLVVNMITVTLSIKRTTDEAGVGRVEINTKMSGGFSTSIERPALDWAGCDEKDNVFGCVTNRGRRISLEEITDEYLKKDWIHDTTDNDIVLIECWSTPGKNKRTWKTVQTWGFAMVNGERRYVGRTVFTSDKRQTPIHSRLVCDYLGPI